MGLRIQTTGLEQYAPGGNARVKVLVIGGPGVGKTRSASYWPKPIYADCEGGLASVADRNVPFAEIKSSQDMLDLLDYLKAECRKPEDQRQFKTVVIDTLDAFQRKIKDEWLQAHPNAGSFSGFDAWGYLDAKMQMLMTRLLNLDMNVYVAVHYTDKTITEGTGAEAKQRQEIQLQLSGAIKDQAFNDFDLVGWMGKYYASVDGQRTEKRGLTFTATPDRPFLKDRLHVTPGWLDITFSDEDYTNLWLGVVSKLDDIAGSEVVGEIPSASDEPSENVVTPSAVAESTLPPVDPKEVPLTQWDVPTLKKMAKEEGVTLKVDGTKLTSNSLKPEWVAAIEKHRAEAAQAAPAEPEAAPAAEEPKQAEPEASAPAETVTEVANGDTVQVNTETGEVTPVPDVTEAEAIKNVENALGGEVVSQETAPAAEPTPEAAPETAPAQEQPEASAAGICESCGTDLAHVKPDFVKLSYIKFRKKLCENCYKEAKKG